MGACAIGLGSCVAIWTDLRRGKIYNWLTAPLFLTGLVYHALSGSGPVFALWGAGVGGLGLVWMYALGYLGAGDVKFVIAVGAWGGAQYAFDVVLLSLVLGSVLALGILAMKKRLPETWLKIQLLLAGLSSSGLRDPGWDRNLKMPFGVPLAIAAVWEFAADPIRALGGPAWL
jgi:prepilin peptidase CpaA